MKSTPHTSSKPALLGGSKAVTLPMPPYPVIGHEEVNAATEVILSRQLSDTGRGPFIRRMEDSYAKFFRAKYCLSLGSGTAAIHSALFAVGVRPGTEVLTCAHTWISGINAILHAGGTPVFCDVKRSTWHIDPAEIARKATPHTRAVIVTHLWGLPADMGPILKVCRKLKIAVVEDVSHAQGSMYKGKYCGTVGDVGALSLQGSKAIVAGEGGCLLTNSNRYYQRAHVPGHHNVRLGKALVAKDIKPFAIAGGAWTYRMPPVCAAIATEQLKKLDSFNAARQANLDRIMARLKRYRFIQWPRIQKGCVRGWYGAPATFDAKRAPISRDTFVAACRAEGVPIGGEGYTDYTQLPLFQDMSVYSQMFVPRHANGVEFKPVKPSEFPNYAALRKTMLLIQIPAIESPLWMDQFADAVDKVMANVAALKAWERNQAKKKRR